MTWAPKSRKTTEFEEPILPREIHAELDMHRQPPVILLVLPGHYFRSYSDVGKHIVQEVGVDKGSKLI